MKNDFWHYMALGLALFMIVIASKVQCNYTYLHEGVKHTYVVVAPTKNDAVEMINKRIIGLDAHPTADTCNTIEYTKPGVVYWNLTPPRKILEHEPCK